MEITVVGSGTLLPDDVHRSAGHLVEWEAGSVLLDCGSGVVHGLARDHRDWRRISHVAISHFHTDHFGDLPALLWAWKHGVSEGDARPRTILGPKGTRSVLDGLAAVFGDFILEPGGPLQVIEMDPRDAWEDSTSGLEVLSHPTRHTPESLAYRIRAAGVQVGYTGDTGPHPPLGGFFRGVDLLIAECAVEDGSEVDIHLSPTTAAQLAVTADPGTLVLTHLYPELKREGLAERMYSLGCRGTVLVAEDGLRISVRPGARGTPRSP